MDEDAAFALKCLREDFEMLRRGEWQPDDDSIDASLGMLDVLEHHLKEV